MNRLTKKNNQGTGSWTQFGDEYIPAHNIKHKQCVNKLGKLEDLEDELGCSLETLFNALKNGIDMDGNGTLLKPRLYYDDVYKQWKFKVYYTPTACGFYNVKDWLKEDLSE